jgi:hypothetical protein
LHATLTMQLQAASRQPRTHRPLASLLPRDDPYVIVPEPASQRR